MTDKNRFLPEMKRKKIKKHITDILLVRKHMKENYPHRKIKPLIKNTLRVVRSTMAAEASSMVDCRDSAFCASKILCEILIMKNIKVNAFIDNKSLFMEIHTTPREHCE